MKILLIYPEYPITFWSFKHALKFVSKKASFPPLGLMTVAAMLPEEWEKKLVDVNVNPLKDEQIAWADMIFISAMIVQKESTQQIIKRCKSFGKIIVAGGPVFTTQHEQFDDVDHFVLNEAEITLPLFLKDLKNGTTQQIYTSKERPDITKTPAPLWSLINLKNYASMAIQYSRGCPYNCEFCDIIIMNGRIPRTKTPEQMIHELQSLYDTGWRDSVFIVDDNFIGNKINVKKTLPLMIEWQKKHKFPFKFMTEASTNLADDKELMQMMVKTNFHKVFLGIETPNLDSLNECGKFQNTSRNLEETVNIIHENGMQVMAGFIVGFDNDTENVFEAQIKFIQNTGVMSAMVGMLTALPQTQLWNRLKAENRLLNDTTGNNTDININFLPKMSPEKLLSGYKKIISTIYSHKFYYDRINTFLKYYKPTVKSRITITDLKAFIRSMWAIGIISKARLLYWKLLIKTLFTNIKALPVVIELAIFGIHYEKVSKAMISD